MVEDERITDCWLTSAITLVKGVDIRQQQGATVIVADAAH